MTGSDGYVVNEKCKYCVRKYRFFRRHRVDVFGYTSVKRSCLVFGKIFVRSIPNNVRVRCVNHGSKTRFYCHRNCYKIGWLYKKNKNDWERAEEKVYRYLQRKFPNSEIRKSSPDFIVANKSFEVKHTKKSCFIWLKNQEEADFYCFIHRDDMKILSYRDFRKLLINYSIWNKPAFRLKWSSIKDIPSVSRYSDFETFIYN